MLNNSDMYRIQDVSLDASLAIERETRGRYFSQEWKDAIQKTGDYISGLAKLWRERKPLGLRDFRFPNLLIKKVYGTDNFDYNDGATGLEMISDEFARYEQLDTKAKQDLANICLEISKCAGACIESNGFRKDLAA